MKSRALKSMEDAGAIIRGHFVYTNDGHGEIYVNKDAIYPDTYRVAELCQMLANKFMNVQINVVAAPTIGGVILSQWTAHHLSYKTRGNVLSVYAEKAGADGKDFEFKRGYDKILAGKNVLVVEDILNSGKSAKKVVDAVRKCGGEVRGVGALFNRGGVSKQFLDVPILHSLVSEKMVVWNEADCPLCKQNVPINTNVGKGAKYLKEKGLLK